MAVDEHAHVVTDDVGRAHCRSMLQVDGLGRIRARGTPKPSMQKETVNRRATRLTVRRDGSDDQMAHANEVAREIGRRETAIRRDDPGQMSRPFEGPGQECVE